MIAAELSEEPIGVRMLDDHDWKRLARYVADECTPAEAEELRAWIESDPERRDAVAFMRDVDAAALKGKPQWDTAASWKHLVARASARKRRPVLVPDADRVSRASSWRSKPRRFRAPLRAAAVLAVAVSGALLWTAQGRWGPLGLGAPPEAEMREYVTARGHLARLRLPDGTQVVVNVASTIRFPAGFGRSGDRNVYLEGEAYFDVRHDSRRRFFVHTANSVIEDLGTKFGVRAYDRDTTVQVVVTEGSVELRASDLPPDRRGALLTEGQVAQLEASGETRIRSNLEVGDYLAWTEGRLVFNDAPLTDVLVELGRWYDIDFEVSDSVIAGRSLTASFGHEAIVESLNLLASTLDFEYELNNRTVTLRPKPGAR